MKIGLQDWRGDKRITITTPQKNPGHATKREETRQNAYAQQATLREMTNQETYHKEDMALTDSADKYVGQLGVASQRSERQFNMPFEHIIVNDGTVYGIIETTPIEALVYRIETDGQGAEHCVNIGRFSVYGRNAKMKNFPPEVKEVIREQILGIIPDDDRFAGVESMVSEMNARYGGNNTL